jgi:hypothetical protein
MQAASSNSCSGIARFAYNGPINTFWLKAVLNPAFSEPSGTALARTKLLLKLLRP